MTEVQLDTRGSRIEAWGLSLVAAAADDDIPANILTSLPQM